MSKRKHDDSQSTPAHTQATPIFSSTPIHDRSSTFTAIFSPTTTSPSNFQSHPPFKTASHRILAWRRPSSQRSITGSFASQLSTTTSKSSQSSNDQTAAKTVCETGSDDDGEQYAGKKLEKLLVDLDVQGTVVVARWYGGVLLGPVRFKWIEDSAKEAIVKWRSSVSGGGMGDEAVIKKVKVGENMGVSEEKQKETLIRVLGERNASIDVLRGLLAEKNLVLKTMELGSDGVDGADASQQVQPSKKSSTIAPDYASMSLENLKRLEKARDATLAWILRQIDNTEEEIKTISKAKDQS